MSQDQLCLLDDEISPQIVGDNRNYISENEPQRSQAQSSETTSEPRKLPQYIAAISATLSALAAGTVLGWTSPILSEIQNGKFHNISVTNNQVGWIGSFVPLGGMFMCIPTGFFCDLIGRKRTLLSLAVPFTLGWLLIIFSKSVIMLYFGRLITGMASGATCVAAPLYTSEIASRHIRGTLGSYFQLMVTVGIFLAYLFGKFLTAQGYTIFCACIPVVFLVIFAFQPESPVYYVSRGEHDRAVAALIRLRGAQYEYGPEIAQIEGALKETRETTLSISQNFRRRPIQKAFIIAMALMFFQQFSGVNAVILYTSKIFSESGVQLDGNTAAIIVGGAQVIATFIASLAVDRLGRKILLILSAAVMALTMLILAIYFTLKYRAGIDENVLQKFGFVPVLALCVFIVVFSLGLGPIPWIISSEIFPNEIKSVASSTAGTFNWFLAFLITKFYLQVSDAVGQDTPFYIFAVISLFGAGFVAWMVPETKGKSIDEIQYELER